MTPTPPPPPPSEQPDWLRDLASRSYEPELLISGAGIYLASSISTGVEHAFNYFNNYLLPTNEGVVLILPTLIYAFLKSIGQVLIFALILHFIIRAFWVGMLGLSSVFPEGIRYESLSGMFYSDVFKEKARESLGSNESFIIRLDKWASTIFALSFMLVLLFVGICFIYTVILIITFILLFVLPPATFSQYESLIYYGLLILVLSPSIGLLVLQLPMFKREVYWQRVSAQIMWWNNILLLPIAGTVVMRLSLIFRSNTGRYSFWYLQGLMLLVMGLFILNLRQRVFGEPSNLHRFFGDESREYLIQANRYENLRRYDDPSMSMLMLESDVITKSHARLFIAYPKMRDKILNQVCKIPPTPAKLSREQGERFRDSLKLACWQQYLRVYVNDSLMRPQPQYAFHVHAQMGNKGLITHLVLKGTARRGLNMLYIHQAIPRDSLLHVLPFWYLPD